MKVTLLVWFAVCALLAAPTSGADVHHANDSGFVSVHEIVLQASTEQAYLALTEDVHLWWDAAHSHGGDAAAFSIDARAGGCFCEQLPKGGSVEHMRVVRVRPGHSLILRGGLGPLQEMAITGSMIFTFTPQGLDEEQPTTLLTYQYSVGGYLPDGLQDLAEPVDRVQLGQLLRLQKFLRTKRPLN